MKLSPAIDLAAVKASALDRIDLVFAAREPRLSHVYLAKAAVARSPEGAAHPLIVAEAAARGVSPADLCAKIGERDHVARDELLAHEMRRQTVKASVRAAASQHDVLAILAAQGAPR